MSQGVKQPIMLVNVGHYRRLAAVSRLSQDFLFFFGLETQIVHLSFFMDKCFLFFGFYVFLAYGKDTLAASSCNDKAKNFC